MALEDHNGNHSHQEHPTADLSFDDLAKGIASGTVSRRKALRILGAALVGGVLASIPGVALAKPKPGKCTRNSQCPATQACINGVCGCPSTTTLCGGSCVSNVCGPNETFNTTICQCETVGCTAGTTGCAGPSRQSFCMERVDGGGTVCICGVDSCAGGTHSLPDCSGCAQYPGSVCVYTFPGSPCDPSFPYACVNPSSSSC